MTELHRWLERAGLERYEEVLRAHDVDLSVVPELTEQDLEKLGFSLGHRRKFLAAAAGLRAGARPVDEALVELPRDPRDAGDQLERRQVTIVFSDLVGSTALAARLDPEDMDVLLRAYREACAAVIDRYDGHVAQFLGDGILAYFGYPRAQEHAAERAVRAGLDIAAAVARLARPDGNPLAARVGIATGLVVAGATGTEGEQTVVGDTPNLAARLQALAGPGEVLVSASTHRLTGNFFEYTYWGEHRLKGIDAPVPAWRALGASAAESRFIAARAAVAAPVVGRERELAFLADAWARAANGNGHVVLISGDAGMGKSRLLEALAERVRDQPHRMLRVQCSPYHVNSALYPFVQLLRHRLDLRRELGDAENRLRLERMLERIGCASRESTLLMAELLGLHAGESLSPAEMTPAQRKNTTFDLIETFLLAPLEGATVLLLIEDAHWSDPSTQALIERVLARIDRDRALVVITHRPELNAAWDERPHATSLRCKQLVPEHCAALARHVAGRRAVGEALIREITARSDGVPLYVEELTKAVLDLNAPGAGSVPLTLQDSLTARLDRLGAAKDVAQMASVIGRQFPYDMLGAVAELDDAVLRAGLERLCESGLVFAAGGEADAVYSFNHALVQEAAYESMTRPRRQALHARIARSLATQLERGGEGELTVIAHHFGRAGDPVRSCEFWLRAAERAGERLAFAEAVADLDAALVEAGRIADADSRARLELDAHLKLGATLVHQKGAQSGEVEAALQNAYRLAKELDDGPRLFQATWGLYLNAARNRRFDRVRVLGHELLAVSDALGDEDLKFEALHHRWGLAHFLGETSNILHYTARGLDWYEPARHHRFSYVFAGHDPGVCAYCVRALGLGVSGAVSEVFPALDGANALADRLQHPMTLLFAQVLGCHALYFTRDAQACLALAGRLVESATRYELPAIRAIGAFWLGAGEVMEGDAPGGVARMAPAFEPTLAYGFLGVLPGVVMAEALARAGRDEEALALIARLLDGTDTPEVGVFMSELWRIRGELLARAKGEDAERCLQTALRIARAQGATLLQSRAGIALAGLLAGHGRRDEARSALAQAGLESLPERDVPELLDAGRLAAALG